MLQNIKTLALLGALAIASPAFAADKAEKPAEKPVEKAAEKPVEAPKPDIANVVAGEYKIDAGHTSVIFRISHLGFSGYMGRFNKTAGTLTIDKDITKSTLDVTIDAASIDTNNEKLEEEIRAKDVFDTATYPAITFKSTKLEPKDAIHGTVTGDLTFHGVTKPVTLDVTLNGVGAHPMSQKPTVGFSATGIIKRSDFGVAKWLPMVGDSVQLIIETEMQKN